MKQIYKWLLRFVGAKLPDPGEWGGRFKWCHKIRNRWARHVSVGISPMANISRGAKICGNGEKLIIEQYASIGINCEVGSDLYIGEHTMMGPNCVILTQNHYLNIDSYNYDGYVTKEVRIGKNCWIGTNVVILPGTVIGDNCIVGAGAVLPGKKYPSYSLIAGNPAVVKKNLKKMNDKI